MTSPGFKVSRIALEGDVIASTTSVDATYTGDDADFDGTPGVGGQDQWKQPVRCATTASVTISTALNAGDTIDGVTLAAGDRVLVKDQGTASQNGIYVAGTTPERAADMESDEQVLGAVVYVIDGTANAGTAWAVENIAATVVDTDDIDWIAFGGGGGGTPATTVTDETTWGITPAVGTDTEYARQDHTHGTPADPGSSGGGNEHNENDAAVLVDATSTGDAGSRADHFSGTSLGGAWAGEASALGSGPTVKYSALGMRQSTNNAHHRLQAYTPSGAFRVEARMRYYLTSGQGGMGLFVRDSSTGDATGNGILAWMNNAGRFEVYSLDTGTYTQRGATLAESLGLPGGWVYIAIERDGSNNWTVQLSLDRALWIAGVSGHSKTFTVAKAGFRLHAGTGATLGSVDFFDVVS